MGHLYQPLLWKAQGTLWKGSQKHCKSQRSGRTLVEWCLLDTTGWLCSWIHSNQDLTAHKTCVSSSQLTFQYGWRRGPLGPTPNGRVIDSWWPLGTAKSVFFKELAPILVLIIQWIILSIPMCTGNTNYTQWIIEKKKEYMKLGAGHKGCSGRSCGIWTWSKYVVYIYTILKE